MHALRISSLNLTPSIPILRQNLNVNKYDNDLLCIYIGTQFGHCRWNALKKKKKT